MPFDDAQRPDFGGGGGGVTKVSELVMRFLGEWLVAMQSEDETVIDAAYLAWGVLQSEPSTCDRDIILKLAAFRVRFNHMAITRDMLCESDVEYFDRLTREACDPRLARLS